LIIPWAAGGSTDILGRVLSKQLSMALGQPFIVENKPGASGNIGANFVAKAKPDGYTLLIDPMSTHVINPALYDNLSFKGVEDFTAIGEIANVPNVLVINSSVPANNLADFVTYAKKHPGQLSYASGGVGSINHISTVMLEHATGIRMVHVPYKGGAPAVIDTVANSTQVLITAPSQVMPFVASGKLKALALTDDHRSAQVPSIPTVAESYPGFNFNVWYAIFGPAHLSKELTERINAAVNQAMAKPEVKQQLDRIGVDIVRGTPEALSRRLHSDEKRYSAIVRQLGIKGE
jgi:tripartite-type tricarboxylate transporter receptor subunit TctC